MSLNMEFSKHFFTAVQATHYLKLKMMNALFLLLATGLSCVLVADANPQFGALAGLGALQSAAKSKKRFRFSGPGYGHKVRGLRRRGRSVEVEAADHDLLLATVDNLDTNGCIAKLLCLTQTKDEADRTGEEDLLLEAFADATKTLSSFNALFVHASRLGSETRDPTVCTATFPKCWLEQEALEELLLDAWGCDCEATRSSEVSSQVGDVGDTLQALV